MASKVSITNRALIIVKAPTIISLTENSEAARTANAIFDDSLDYLISLHPWNFAMVRTSLARLTTTPEYGWSYEYQLPVNPYCLKVESVYNEIDYAVEGRKLLADETTVKIKYLARITDMNQLPSFFREVVAFYLASIFAGSLIGDTALQANIQSQFIYTLNKAKVRDAQEGTPPQRKEGRWIKTRYNQV